MIIIDKVCDGEYIVFNKENCKAADVIKINEYNAFAKSKVTYRVDFEGRTVLSGVSLPEAKSEARKRVKTKKN